MAKSQQIPRIRFGTDLVAYYDLNRGFSGTAKISDASRNGNTGVVNGSSALPKRPGFDFDGTEDRIEIADSTSFDDTAKKTACVWAKNNSANLSASEVFLSKYSINDGKLEWSAGVWPDETFNVTISEDGTFDGDKSWWWASTLPVTSTDEWHLYAFTFNGGTFVMYIDGEAVGASDSHVNTGTVLNNDDAPVLIGAIFADSSGPTYTSYWAGRIGQVMIYNRALSANDISGLYRQTRAAYRV